MAINTNQILNNLDRSGKIEPERSWEIPDLSHTAEFSRRFWSHRLNDFEILSLIRHFHVTKPIQPYQDIELYLWTWLLLLMVKFKFGLNSPPYFGGRLNGTFHGHKTKYSAIWWSLQPKTRSCCSRPMWFSKKMWVHEAHWNSKVWNSVWEMSQWQVTSDFEAFHRSVSPAQNFPHAFTRRGMAFCVKFLI